MKRIATILLATALAVAAADSASTARDAHRSRIDAAIEAGDYQAWKAERDAWGAGGRASERVTPENFPTYVRLHRAIQAGNAAEAARLREELGMPGAGARSGVGCQRHGSEGRARGEGRGEGRGKGGGCGRSGSADAASKSL